MKINNANCCKMDDSCQINNLYNDVILNAKINTAHNTIDRISGYIFKYNILCRSWLYNVKDSIKYNFNYTKLGHYLTQRKYKKERNKNNAILLKSMKYADKPMNENVLRLIRKHLEVNEGFVTTQIQTLSELEKISNSLPFVVIPIDNYNKAVNDYNKVILQSNIMETYENFITKLTTTSGALVEHDAELFNSDKTIEAKKSNVFNTNGEIITDKLYLPVYELLQNINDNK